MKMKKGSLNLRFGNHRNRLVRRFLGCQKSLAISRHNKKAVVFAIDAMFAVILVLFIILLTHNTAIKYKQSNLPTLQPSYIINDAITVMDRDNEFDSLNMNGIKHNLEQILPSNYNVKLEINCQVDGLTEDATSLPANKQIISSQIPFVTDEDNCKLKYWLWLG